MTLSGTAKQDSSRTGEFRTANIIAVAGIFGGAVAQVVFAPFLKEYFGVSGLGTWHLIFQLFMYLQLLDLGLSNSLVLEIASNRDSDDTNRLGVIHATAHRMFCWIGVFFTIFTLACARIVPMFVTLPETLQPDFIRALYMLAAWGFFRYYGTTPLQSLRGQNRIVLYNWLLLLETMGRPLAAIGFCMIHRRIYSVILGYIAIELAVRVIARISLSPFRKTVFSADCFRRLLTVGGEMTLIRISNLILVYSSSLIAGWRLNIESVAAYQSTIALPFFVSRLATIPFMNLLPRLVRVRKDEGTVSFGRMARTQHFRVMALFLLLFGLAGILNDYFVTLWVGRNLYAGGVFTLLYIMFAYLSLGNHNGYMAWQAFGRLRPMVVVHLVQVPTCLLLSVILIDRMGLDGLPLAYLISLLPVFVVAQTPLLCTRRLLPAP